MLINYSILQSNDILWINMTWEKYRWRKSILEICFALYKFPRCFIHSCFQKQRFNSVKKKLMKTLILVRWQRKFSKCISHSPVYSRQLDPNKESHKLKSAINTHEQLPKRDKPLTAKKEKKHVQPWSMNCSFKIKQMLEEYQLQKM